MIPPEEIVLGPEEIAQRIFMLRGQRVLLDADLARIYGVPTGRLNEQVKRNVRRFPEDFVFLLTREETQSITRLRSQNAILKKGQHIKHLPYAFTEHGAIQAANVLNSDAAIELGVHVVRAFVRLRQWLLVGDVEDQLVLHRPAPRSGARIETRGEHHGRHRPAIAPLLLAPA